MSVIELAMICEVLVCCFLLGLAIYLTRDVFKRVDTLKLAQMKLDELTDLIIKLHKRNNELEEKVFKAELMRKGNKNG